MSAPAGVSREIRALPFGQRRTIWRVAESVRCVAWVSVDGRFRFILTRNMDGQPYPWRVSRFAGDEPIGHSYGATADDAARNGLDGWGVVPLYVARA